MGDHHSSTEVAVYRFPFLMIAGANNPPGSILYDTGLGEDTPTKVFNIMGALSTIAFAYSTVIIPEIQVKTTETHTRMSLASLRVQHMLDNHSLKPETGPEPRFEPEPVPEPELVWSQATLREPVVKNFVTKSLLVTYGAGAPIFVVMTYVGFWAYGSGVAPNLIENLSGTSPEPPASPVSSLPIPSASPHFVKTGYVHIVAHTTALFFHPMSIYTDKEFRPLYSIPT